MFRGTCINRRQLDSSIRSRHYIAELLEEAYKYTTTDGGSFELVIIIIGIWRVWWFSMT